MLRSMTTIGLVLFGAVTSLAADIGRIRPLTAQLDDERFIVREKATNALITTDHKIALSAVARTAETGSPEARGRALHVLAMWHRSDKTSHAAVKAIAKRWQEDKNKRVTRLGHALAARTAPKPVLSSVQSSTWAVEGISVDEIVLDSIISVDVPVEPGFAPRIAVPMPY